jgi:hypothetical protein
MHMKASEWAIGSGSAQASATTTKSCRMTTSCCGRVRTSISSSACSTIQRPHNLDRWHLNEARRAMVEPTMATRHGGGRKGG